MSFILRFAQLNGILGDIFNALGSWITNVIHGFMSYMFASVYTTSFLPIAMVVDGILWIFRKFAGLDTYVLDGQVQSGDIALGLINNSVVQSIFWSLLVLAIVLLFITTFVAVIKSEYTSVDDKSKLTNARVLAKSFKALLNFIIVPVISVVGLMLGNAILKSLDQATSGSNSFSVGSRIFVAAAYSANRARVSERFADDLSDGLNNFGIFTESGGSAGGDTLTLADKVDEAFINSRSMGGLRTLTLPNVNFFDSKGTYAFAIFYLPALALPHTNFSIYDVPLVMWYYDLVSFSYLIGIAAGAAIAFILLQMAVGLIKRLFYLATLLVISPPIVALTPIDNGTAMGKWRQKFIANALAAYSSVVALNLFIVLLGPLTSIDFFYINASNDLLVLMDEFIKVIGGYRLFNSLIQLLIMVSGFIFFKKMTKDLAEIIGGDDAYGEGAEASKKIAQGIGKVAALAAAVMTGGAAAGALSAMNKGGGGSGGPDGAPGATPGDTPTGAGGADGGGGKNPQATNIPENGGLGTNVKQPGADGTPDGTDGGTVGIATGGSSDGGTSATPATTGGGTPKAPSGGGGGGKGKEPPDYAGTYKQTISISRRDALKNLFSLASGGLTDEAVNAYEKGSTYAQGKKKMETDTMGKFNASAGHRKMLSDKEKEKKKQEKESAKAKKDDAKAQQSTKKLQELQEQYDKEVKLSKFGKNSDVANDIYDHIQTIKDREESVAKAERDRQTKEAVKLMKAQMREEEKKRKKAQQLSESAYDDVKRVQKTDSAQEKRANKKK